MVIPRLHIRFRFSSLLHPHHKHSQSQIRIMSSAAKHVLNDPATLVVDSLKGLATLNPEVKLDEASRGESVPSPPTSSGT